MRWENVAAKSSCFRVMMGQFTLFLVSNWQDLLMADRDSHSDKLSQHRLNPHLQQTPLSTLRGYSSTGYGRTRHVCLPHIGLMKHIWVVVQREEMSRICCFLEGEQIRDAAFALSNVNPFLHVASSSIALKCQ